MEYLVIKPVVTPTKRIPSGAMVAAGDIDGPVTAEEWVRLGHLVSEHPATAEPAATFDTE